MDHAFVDSSNIYVKDGQILMLCSFDFSGSFHCFKEKKYRNSTYSHALKGFYVKGIRSISNAAMQVV